MGRKQQIQYVHVFLEGVQARVPLYIYIIYIYIYYIFYIYIRDILFFGFPFCSLDNFLGGVLVGKRDFLFSEGVDGCAGRKTSICSREQHAYGVSLQNGP